MENVSSEPRGLKQVERSFSSLTESSCQLEGKIWRNEDKIEASSYPPPKKSTVISQCRWLFPTIFCRFINMFCPSLFLHVSLCFLNLSWLAIPSSSKTSAKESESCSGAVQLILRSHRKHLLSFQNNHRAKTWWLGKIFVCLLLSYFCFPLGGCLQPFQSSLL